MSGAVTEPIIQLWLCTAAGYGVRFPPTSQRAPLSGRPLPEQPLSPPHRTEPLKDDRPFIHSYILGQLTVFKCTFGKYVIQFHLML